MQTRKLGNSVLEVSPIMLGGNVFGWTADETASFRVLDAFVDAGFNFIDTADVYSKWVPGHQGGESETVIGKWLRRSGKRDKVLLATKVGIEMAPDRKGLSRFHILRSAEESLQRLQTDVIDLYQSHVDDAATPLEETLQAYAQLIKEGKIRVIGASNYGADRLRQALQLSEQDGFPAYRSLQPQYNLDERRDYEMDLEPLIEQKGLGVIPYYSLAAGFLTGKYRSEADLSNRARGSTVKKYLNERGFRILGALDEIANAYGATPTQISLAWLLARPSITAPIASATSTDQLRDLISATQLELDDQAISQLNQASAEHTTTASA